MFVAGRHIKVIRDGKAVMLNPGDPVPEAKDFEHRVLTNLMKVGHILNVEAPGEVPPAALKQQALTDAKQVKNASPVDQEVAVVAKSKTKTKKKH